MVGFEGPDGRGEMGGVGKALTSFGGERVLENAERGPHLLFGVLRTSEGYKVSLSYVAGGKIVSTKLGADQLKHHALSMIDSLMTQYVIDSYNEPLKFFETAQVR